MEQLILVFGEPVKELPKDLYIPPQALRVLLESFEGPLDLLLYLIRKQKMDILDIPVTQITSQYLHYIHVMQTLDISLAAEYLLMAATLAEIKAHMMLPQVVQENEDEDEIDPRIALQERLQAYAQTVKAAQALAAWARIDAGLMLSAHQPPKTIRPRIKPDCDVQELQRALQQLRARQSLKAAHKVQEEAFSLAERVEKMEVKLRQKNSWQSFADFYTPEEGRGGKVVSLMALLELDKAQVIEWQQASAFADIRLRARKAT